MGNSESSFSDVSGFRIVHLWKGSPAHVAGLELFFDHILEVDGSSFVEPSKVHPSQFSKQITACENRTVKLVVYNSRTRAFRDIWVTPYKWSDEGYCGLLGASVRYTNNITEIPGGLRVLNVFPNSPASKAGLIPLDDYLMGSIETDFETLDDLIDVVSAARAEANELSLSVYNAKQESVRRITLRPDHQWGGKGYLGCDIGQGLIHRLPPLRFVHPNSYSRYVLTGRRDSLEEETLSQNETIAGLDHAAHSLRGQHGIQNVAPEFWQEQQIQPMAEELIGTTILGQPMEHGVVDQGDVGQGSVCGVGQGGVGQDIVGSGVVAQGVIGPGVIARGAVRPGVLGQNAIVREGTEPFNHSRTNSLDKPLNGDQSILNESQRVVMPKFVYSNGNMDQMVMLKAQSNQPNGFFASPNSGSSIQFSEQDPSSATQAPSSTYRPGSPPRPGVVFQRQK